MHDAATLKRTYFVVFGALLALTLLTTGIAFVNLGPFSTPIALAIAITKAGLVMLYFMHLRSSSFLVRVFAGSAILWLLHMMAYTLIEILTR